MIDKIFSEFDDHEADILRHALASFLKVSPSAIRVLDKSEGSVRITLELPDFAAADLLLAYQNKDPFLAKQLARYTILGILPVEEQHAAGAVLSEYHLGFLKAASGSDPTSLMNVAEIIGVPPRSEYYKLFSRYYQALANYFLFTLDVPHNIVSNLVVRTFARGLKELSSVREPEKFHSLLFQIAQIVAREFRKGEAETHEAPTPAGENLPSDDDFEI